MEKMFGPSYLLRRVIYPSEKSRRNELSIAHRFPATSVPWAVPLLDPTGDQDRRAIVFAMSPKVEDSIQSAGRNLGFSVFPPLP